MAIHLDAFHTDARVRDRLFGQLHEALYRDALELIRLAADLEAATPIRTCLVVGHAPECECATL